jgi:hypothetical protein|tara:strand:- start:105 stop:359 length:255 start_codon:yes stop_codon:yes gene_type:complete
MTKTKSKKTDKADLIDIPSELLDINPIELSENQEGIDKVIAYLQTTRENIRATEKAGKPISKSAARTKPAQYEKDPLTMLLSET